MFDAFTSDPHYGHANIIKFCSRPFADVNEMTEELIKRHNEVVSPTGSACWLGDCFFLSSGEAKKILARLNGRKTLIRGNHDDGSSKKYLDLGFDLVVERDMVIKIGGVTVRLCHFPYKPFYPTDERYVMRMPSKEKDVVLMHGHTHVKDRVTKEGCLHAGVDAWDYRPATYEEMAALAKDL